MKPHCLGSHDLACIDGHEIAREMFRTLEKAMAIQRPTARTTSLFVRRHTYSHSAACTFHKHHLLYAYTGYTKMVKKTVRFADGATDAEQPSTPKILPLRPKRRISGALSKLFQDIADLMLELTDHHSALRFLDNTYADGEERPDDYVIALAGAKRAENDSSSHQDQVTKAVQLIANHRDSAVLRA